MSFTQEFGGEEDVIVIEGFAQLLRVANGNRRFDDNPGVWRILADCLNRSFDARSIEIILLLVVIRRRGDYSEIGIRVRFLRVDGGVEIERTLARCVPHQEIGDYRIDDRTLAVVQQRDLRRNDVERMHLIMLGKQQRDGQSNIAGSCNRNLHNQTAFPVSAVILTYCRRVTPADRQSRCLSGNSCRYSCHIE